MQILVASSLLPARVCCCCCFKEKDPAFDEPAVGLSTIATAPSPLICPEGRLGKDRGGGWGGREGRETVFPRSINLS